MNPHVTQSQVQAHTVVSSDQQSAANARLHGGRLVFARICWLVLAVLAVPIFVTGLPLYFANLQVACNSYSCNYGQLRLQSAQLLQNLGISLSAYALFALVLTIAITMVWFIVAGVIFWRKSDDWIALLVSLALILVFLLFPDGRFAPHWMVLLAVAWIVYVADTFILPLFIGNSPFISWNWPFPLNLLVLIALFCSLAFSVVTP